jgi:uncharacterized protein with PIN domain
MLGSLARWLRFSGFDVTFDPGAGGRRTAAHALHEGRWLLTCDVTTASHAGPRVLLLKGSRVAEQVAEVTGRLGVVADPARYFTRCSRCNAVLRDVDPAEAADRVPPFVAAHVSRFRGCAGCGRVYWPGTHHERIAARLRELFG